MGNSFKASNMSLETTSHQRNFSKSTGSELMAVREVTIESPEFLSKERIKEEFHSPEEKPSVKR